MLLELKEEKHFLLDQSHIQILLRPKPKKSFRYRPCCTIQNYFKWHFQSKLFYCMMYICPSLPLKPMDVQHTLDLNTTLHYISRQGQQFVVSMLKTLVLSLDRAFQKPIRAGCQIY